MVKTMEIPADYNVSSRHVAVKFEGNKPISVCNLVKIVQTFGIILVI